MSSSVDRALGLLALACLGCGTSASDHDGGLLDAGADSPCVSAGGLHAVCKGFNDCFPGAEQGQNDACPFCSSFDLTKPGLCVPPDDINSGPTSDGQIYVEYEPLSGLWGPYSYDVGPLLAANGGADQVRYADWSAWTGDPLPEPSTCPTFTSFRICGGNCGACKAGEICTGRSPDHPYSICASMKQCGYVAALADAGTPWTGCTPDAGQTCLTFQSSPDGQVLADQNGNGFCIDDAACQEAQTSYPGGVFCHATQ